MSSSPRVALLLAAGFVACSGGDELPASVDAGTDAGVVDAGPDPRCSLEGCHTLVEIFRQQFIFDADYDGCVSRVGNGDGKRPDFDALAACPALCVGERNGALLACLEEKEQTCRDAPVGAESTRICDGIVDECNGQARLEKIARNKGCENACLRARMRCESACSIANFNACFDCSLACTTAHGACLGACPVATIGCTNRVKDGAELDVDCGGTCGPCGVGKACAADADCALTKCVAGKCAQQVGCTKTTPCAAGTWCFADGCYPL